MTEITIACILRLFDIIGWLSLSPQI